jgi:hypothetical protein
MSSNTYGLKEVGMKAMLNSNTTWRTCTECLPIGLENVFAGRRLSRVIVATRKVDAALGIASDEVRNVPARVVVDSFP